MVRVAHASRVLAMVSRHRELFKPRYVRRAAKRYKKIVAARHRNQHARRVRYPGQSCAHAERM